MKEEKVHAKVLNPCRRWLKFLRYTPNSRNLDSQRCPLRLQAKQFWDACRRAIARLLSLANLGETVSADSRSNNEKPWLHLESELSNLHPPFLIKHPRSKQNCICGHTLSPHHETQGSSPYSKHGNIFCRCETLDAHFSFCHGRFFTRSSQGSGAKPAVVSELNITSNSNRGANSVF